MRLLAHLDHGVLLHQDECCEWFRLSQFRINLHDWHPSVRIHQHIEIHPKNLLYSRLLSCHVGTRQRQDKRPLESFPDAMQVYR